jgi:hypothetical protein
MSKDTIIQFKTPEEESTDPFSYSGDSDHLYWFYSIIRSSQRDELIVSL